MIGLTPTPQQASTDPRAPSQTGREASGGRNEAFAALLSKLEGERPGKDRPQSPPSTKTLISTMSAQAGDIVEPRTSPEPRAKGQPVAPALKSENAQSDEPRRAFAGRRATAILPLPTPRSDAAPSTDAATRPAKANLLDAPLPENPRPQPAPVPNAPAAPSLPGAPIRLPLALADAVPEKPMRSGAPGAAKAAAANSVRHALQRGGMGLALNGQPTAAPLTAAAPQDMPEISLTRRETHLPPVRRPDAVEALHLSRQLAGPTTGAERPSAPFAVVAEQIRAALSPQAADGDTGQRTLAANASAAQLAQAGPLRIIELSLQPASLGALTITLRLSGAGLRVSIAADTRETSLMLQDEEAALAALVSEAGYGTGEIDVRYQPRA